MTLYDDPNRESVGLEPIWTGAGEDAETLPTEEQADDGGFDPGEHTVAEVEEYLEAHPDEYDSVIEAETAGKNRTTLTGGA